MTFYCAIFIRGEEKLGFVYGEGLDHREECCRRIESQEPDTRVIRISTTQVPNDFQPINGYGLYSGVHAGGI